MLILLVEPTSIRSFIRSVPYVNSSQFVKPVAPFPLHLFAFVWMFLGKRLERKCQSWSKVFNLHSRKNGRKSDPTRDQAAAKCLRFENGREYSNRVKILRYSVCSKVCRTFIFCFCTMKLVTCWCSHSLPTKNEFRPKIVSYDGKKVNLHWFQWTKVHKFLTNGSNWQI